MKAPIVFNFPLVIQVMVHSQVHLKVLHYYTQIYFLFDTSFFYPQVFLVYIKYVTILIFLHYYNYYYWLGLPHQKAQ